MPTRIDSRATGAHAQRMANNPTAITATLAATHLSVEQLSQMFLASIRETFPAATPMEIEDITIPGTR